MTMGRGGWTMLFTSLGGTIQAATGPTYGSSVAPITQSQPVSFDGFAKVVVTALALILLVGVGLYLLKNGVTGFRKQTGSERKLQVLETKVLGGRQFLMVVQYEDSKVLLGVTPGKIDYLCPLESKPSPAAPAFSQVLDRTAKPDGEEKP